MSRYPREQPPLEIYNMEPEIVELSIDHFKEVLDRVLDQVTQGKGKERHGQSSDFEFQPWRHISDNVGDGFCLGQAMKKLMELRFHSSGMEKASREGNPTLHSSAFEKWKTDALGAVVYTIMAIMHNEHKVSRQLSECKENKDRLKS